MPRSVPIVFFGEIDKARFATIAINPSNKEFTNDKHEIFPPGKKRVVDRDCLGVADGDALSLEQAERVYESLCNFFHNRPYMGWFGPLEKLFSQAVLSYFKGDIINLDISPWATSVKWKDMSEDERTGLISHGGDYPTKPPMRNRYRKIQRHLYRRMEQLSTTAGPFAGKAKDAHGRGCKSGKLGL